MQGIDAKQRERDVLGVLRHSFVDLAPKLQTHEEPTTEAVDLNRVVQLHMRIVGEDLRRRDL